VKAEAVARLGAPDVELAGLQLWVHGYQFPEATDAWDGNWLRVTAHCGAQGASVWTDGAILETVSFLRFRRELADLYQTLNGQAELSSYEPNLVATVRAASSAGQLSFRVDITPNHLSQAHWFEYEIDQSYLPPVAAACDRLLARYAVRDPAQRGV
jgi:hypothetical protein